jgi:hypothetical protein
MARFKAIEKLLVKLHEGQDPRAGKGMSGRCRTSNLLANLTSGRREILGESLGRRNHKWSKGRQDIARTQHLSKGVVLINVPGTYPCGGAQQW